MKKIILVALLMTLLVTGCGKKEDKGNTDKKDENAVNEKDQNVKSFEDQTIEGILISDFNLNFVDNITDIYAKVKNTTEEDKRVEQINIVLTDKEGKEVNTMFYLGRTIKAGEEIQVQSSITGNVATSTKVNYEIQF